MYSGAFVWLDMHWRCTIIGFNWNRAEALLFYRGENIGWADVSRLTPVARDAAGRFARVPRELDAVRVNSNG